MSRTRRSSRNRNTLIAIAAAALAAAAPVAAQQAATPAGEQPVPATAAAPAPDQTNTAPSLAKLTGFGAAAFGSSIEDARSALPAMEVLSKDVKMPSAAFTSPFLERFVIRKHTIDGLAKPVDVELRFWEGKLWAFLVYYDKSDMTAALQHLEKTYGPRTTGTEMRPIWRGERVTLQAMGEAGWYGATDNAISDRARAWFFKELTGGSQGQQMVQEAAKAATTPAAGATAAAAGATVPAGATPGATQPAAPAP